MSKQPPAKKPHGYSLLLKGVKEIAKSKHPKKTSSKKESESDRPGSSQRNSADNGTRSKQGKSNELKPEVIEDPDIPDRSFGDYYCKICDSHMNAIDMWEAHITGKRHIKNVEKGDTDSKYEDLPNAESTIKYELKDIKDPIVGLTYIHEIRRKEPNIPPIYNCFLCHASIATVPLVTEHVLSLKHRYNYIKENDPDEYALMSATNLKKGLLEPLVIEAVIKLEEKFGRGTVTVKQEKQKKTVSTYSFKKTFNLDAAKKAFNLDAPKKILNVAEDKSYKTSRSDSSPIGWRSFHSEKRRERSRSRSREEDRYKNRSRSRSPRCYNEKMYSEQEYSMTSRRSFSKKDSPSKIVSEQHGSSSKRDVSKYNQEYLQPSRKNDFSTETNYVSPRYSYNQEYLQTSRKNDLPSEVNYPISRHSSRPQVSVKESPNSVDQLQQNPPLSITQVLLRDLRSSGITVSDSGKIPIEQLLSIISLFSVEARFELFSHTLNAIPEPINIEDTLYLLQVMTEIKKKVNESSAFDTIKKFVSQRGNSESIIPGLEGAVPSSSAELDNFRSIASSSSAANSTFTPSGSNTPINSQQTVGMNPMAPGNFQSPGHLHQNVPDNFPQMQPYLTQNNQNYVPANQNPNLNMYTFTKNYPHKY